MRKTEFWSNSANHCDVFGREFSWVILFFPSQLLALASNTLKFAASAIRIQQQQSTTVTKEAQDQSLQEYTLEEVSWHDNRHDCWIVIQDKIYDITSLMSGHPGGYDVLLEQAGRDATWAFRGVGHSIDALEQMDEYLVGILPPHQRIYLR